jgi:hypothetical protein
VSTLGRDQQVIAAMVTALNTDVPTGMPVAGRNAWIVGMPLTETRISVIPAKEQNRLPQGRLSKIAHRHLMIGVQCAAPAETLIEGDDAVADLAVHVIAALSDSTLDNLATDIEEVAREWERFKADLIYVVHTIFFQVNYQTLRGDLTRKA